MNETASGTWTPAKLMVCGTGLLVACCVVTGTGFADLYERGRDPSTGALVNVLPSGAFDPGRPTLVFVHGSNPFAGAMHFTMAQTFGRVVSQRYGDGFNVLGWDWNSDTIVSVRMKKNLEHAVDHGRMLGDALLGAGIPPQNVQLIGQSAGCVVATSAARRLWERTGRQAGQLTLIDPASLQHGLIFEQLGAGGLALKVENIWVPGVSGYGEQAPYAGVWNTRLDLPDPRGWRGVVRPLHSDHLAGVAWYIASVEQGVPGQGFGTSVFLAR